MYRTNGMDFSEEQQCDMIALQTNVTMQDGEISALFKHQHRDRLIFVKHKDNGQKICSLTRFGNQVATAIKTQMEYEESGSISEEQADAAMEHSEKALDEQEAERNIDDPADTGDAPPRGC